MDALRSKNKGKNVIQKNSKQNLNVMDSGKSDSPQVQLEVYSQRTNLEKPCIMPLLPIANVESSSSALQVLSGTACKGSTGPPIGAYDVGISKSAYYLRVALPGVRKDPGEFNFEVEGDGMVHIQGLTSTGGKTVSKYGRVFEMKVKQHCPPGPFTLCYSLPGVVDPRLVSANLRSDGVFEAVIVKHTL